MRVPHDVVDAEIGSGQGLAWTLGFGAFSAADGGFMLNQFPRLGKIAGLDDLTEEIESRLHLRINVIVLSGTGHELARRARAVIAGIADWR